MKKDGNMIKNIIFDMGNVLVEYDPYYIISENGIDDPEDAKLILENTFLSDNWKKNDLGVYDEDDIYSIVAEKIPERLHAKLRKLLDNWHASLRPVKGMDQLIEALKKKGLKIYLLSNAGRSKDLYWENVPGSRFFDGGVVSAFEGCVKPDRKIYEILLGRYDLKPEECLFIDDMEANIEGAKALGIKGYHYDGNVEALQKYIFENIIKEEIKDADK